MKDMMGWIQVKAIIAHWFPLLYWKCNHGGEMFLQGGREHFYKMTGSLYFYFLFFLWVTFGENTRFALLTAADVMTSGSTNLHQKWPVSFFVCLFFWLNCLLKAADVFSAFPIKSRTSFFHNHGRIVHLLAGGLANASASGILANFRCLRAPAAREINRLKGFKHYLISGVKSWTELAIYHAVLCLFSPRLRTDGLTITKYV